MQFLKRYADEKLHMTPEQTQIFTPTPSTWSTLMYVTETDPFTGQPIFVEKDPNKRQKQKDALILNQKSEIKNQKYDTAGKQRPTGGERLFREKRSEKRDKR